MSTWKERFEDILDDVQGRFRNPIILSFILVWLYFHWSILYKVFTMDNAVNVDDRTYKIQHYISEEEWKGMIGLPLLVSFSSLIAFYLIGIAAQFIKVMVGKRLNAALLAKIDTGNYALKEEIDRYKKDNARKQERIERLVDSKGALESRLFDTEEQLKTVQKSHGIATTRIEDLEEENSKQLQAYTKQDKVAQKENDELSLAREELTNKIDMLNTHLANEQKENSRVSSLLQYNANPKKTLKDIFGKSTWLYTPFGAESPQQQTFQLKGDSFLMDNGTAFLIMDFHFNPVDKTIYFNKSNSRGDPKVIPNWLHMVDNDFLTGTEEPNLQVEYSRVQ